MKQVRDINETLSAFDVIAAEFNSKPFDILVNIIRGHPLHNAHVANLELATQMARKVVVIVGSSYQPRTFKNPFTFDERKQLIRDAMEENQCDARNGVIVIQPNIDTIYDDDAWMIRIQEIVGRCSSPTDKKIGIIGFSKDPETERYLRMFPQWKLVDVPHTTQLNATEIRDIYFSEKFTLAYLKGVVPKTTLDFLEKFSRTDEYHNIWAEKKFIDAYRKKKEVYEYPIIGITVDNVIIQAGHILLIKRRAIPGKGLWALPGGYFHAETTYKPDGTVDTLADRTPLDGMLRELEEETKIDLPMKVLRGSLHEIRTFCAPGRSLLGRSITFAGFFRLTDGEWNLPKVKGSDDALKAKWVPLSDLRKDRLFDDHFDIIQAFVPSVKAY